MSSVCLRFLFYGYLTYSVCATPSAIIGAAPNHACIGMPVGANVAEYVIAQSYCSGKSIADFNSISPVGMTKSAIINLGSDLYQIILSWIPTSDQLGPQGFCAGVVDNTYIQSEQWCIAFLVDFESPDIIRRTAVPGLASPL